jgi:multidrug efflux pump subunit AcrA (membrane-fusion protein)
MPSRSVLRSLSYPTSALALALALAGCGGGGGDGPTPPTTPVASVDTLFTFPSQWSSPELRIRAGGTVVFVFEGGIAHNAIFRLNPADAPLPGAPADIPNTINSVVRRTFAAAGEFPVNCTIHPGMLSRVVVAP